MSETEANNRETAGYRAAIDAFMTKLVEHLGSDSSKRDAFLRQLAGTSHEHHTVAVLASTYANGKFKGLHVRVRIEFGEVEDTDKLAQQFTRPRLPGVP